MMTLTEFADMRAKVKGNMCWVCNNLTDEQKEEIKRGREIGLNNSIIQDWIKHDLGRSEVTRARVRYHFDNHGDTEPLFS